MKAYQKANLAVEKSNVDSDAETQRRPVRVPERYLETDDSAGTEGRFCQITSMQKVN